MSTNTASPKSASPARGAAARSDAPPTLVKRLVTLAFGEVSGMVVRHTLLQFLSLGLIVTSALMIWKFLILWTGSESPVVVVLSGSMEPAFYRGDILFLNNGPAPITTGEVVVFNIDGRDIPIVHRVIKVHDRGPAVDSKGADLERGGEKLALPPRGAPVQDILTKGDNNWGDDRALYARGQKWLAREHIMGRVVGFLPHVGRVTIIMNDYPFVKYALIGILGLFVVTSKE